MATLVLTTIGTAIGGPIGGALGSLVGQSIDQGLFGPGPRKGPRLGDLSVQTSSYGSPLPRIYGRMRVAGTVVWATDLKEEEAIEGGGKSGPERQTYSYSVSLAVALSSRPINAVRRIWADGRLIRGASGDFKVKTKFRLTPGGEDQAVDALIASLEGVEDSPAYRGLALAIFEDLELAEFGNRIPMLTFEVEADDQPVPLSTLLSDAAGGAIAASDNRPIAGFAAHGTSIRDGLAQLIEVSGIELTERGGTLQTPAAAVPVLIANEELGCDPDGEPKPRVELGRSPDSALPAGLSLTYYDPDRDYQTGQMRAHAGNSGARDERIELPAVLTAGEAKLLAEVALARRWRAGDELALRLPPGMMALRPGDAVQLAGSARSWTIRTVLIEGLTVIVEARASPVTIQPLPADPGRPVVEPDIAVGRSELLLFELPAEGDAPLGSPRAYVAASNNGMWKSVPVELALGSELLPAISLARRAVLGRAQTSLDPRCPMVLDELSSVLVQLTNSAQQLLNADADAMMSGANLALLGSELLQFGRAEQLGPGLYRLSSLLRGRRGTEWAAPLHSIGDGFCLIDAASIRAIDMNGGVVGASLTATAHGIGDVAPLPVAERLISGEAVRPPSPCHLMVLRNGNIWTASWVRRSHRGWSWIDGVGVGEDGFPERYRITARGPLGELVIETDETSHSFATSQLPGGAGQAIDVEVAMIGPAALSRGTSATVTL